MPPHKGAVSRPNDFFYGKCAPSPEFFRPLTDFLDPLFIVSGPKDHMKAALIAKISMAKFVNEKYNLIFFYSEQ